MCALFLSHSLWWAALHNLKFHIKVLCFPAATNFNNTVPFLTNERLNTVSAEIWTNQKITRKDRGENVCTGHILCIPMVSQPSACFGRRPVIWNFNLKIWGNIWEAGKLLWNRNVTVAATKGRFIRQSTAQSFLSGIFKGTHLTETPDNSSTLLPYFALPFKRWH